jgi:PhoH-like ATPase
MVRKLFVLDTNVLLHDPRAIYKFEEHEVVLPIYVLEEVDKFKTQMNELGRNARTISRFIDDLRGEAPNGLQGGLTLPSGGILRVAVPPNCLFERTTGDYDSRILQVAQQERDTHPDRITTLVSMDTNVRIRADALRIKAENYDGDRIDQDELYTGFLTLTVSAQLVDRLGKRQPVDLAELDLEQVYPNACVMLVDEGNPKHSALGRVDVSKTQVVGLKVPREGAWGIRPRNLEQSFALDLLLNDKVQLITLVGRAGTGKTLLAVAAGLKQVVGEGSHSRLLVSRPVMPLGKDVGYLPGTLEEKLNPWMQPIFDNLEYIFSSASGRHEAGRSYEELLASGTIQVEALTYIRGRSIPQQFMIVDEAQNLTSHELKTIITRAGEGTKIVLTGDPQQIDNPILDSQSNGLTVVAERFKSEAIAGHVTLSKGERSDLAEIASRIL